MKLIHLCAFVSPFAFSIATASLLFCLAKGNQQILAWPIAMWLILFLWPRKPKQSRIAINNNSHMLFIIAVISLGISFLLVVKALAKQPEVIKSGVVEALDEAERMFHQGKYDESLIAFKNIHVPVSEPMQRARKHHNCGVILIYFRNYDDAVEHLRLSLHYDRSNVQAAYLLAAIAAEMGDSEEMQRMLHAALRIDSNYEPALRLLKGGN